MSMRPCFYSCLLRIACLTCVFPSDSSQRRAKFTTFCPPSTHTKRTCRTICDVNGQNGFFWVITSLTLYIFVDVWTALVLSRILEVNCSFFSQCFWRCQGFSTYDKITPDGQTMLSYTPDGETPQAQQTSVGGLPRNMSSKFQLRLTTPINPSPPELYDLPFLVRISRGIRNTLALSAVMETY